MNFQKILPLSRSRLDVMFEIYAENSDYLRNIAKKLKMNTYLAFKILNALYNANFLTKKKIGKEIQYSLNKNRDYAILVKLLEEYHFEKVINKPELLKSAINLMINNKDLMDSSYRIYLFGSYVSGIAQKKSDIDVLFVNEDRALVGKTCREISLIVGVNINPLIYTKKKFKSELSRKEPMLSSIVNVIRNRVVIK